MLKKMINKAQSPKFSQKLLTSVMLGGLCSLLPVTVKAQDTIEIFDNQGIRFTQDTTVEFGFQQSNGAYQSVLGVINLETGEKTPLILETKPSDQFQNVDEPSSYTEDLSVSDDRDFKGTPGNAVPEPTNEFLFKANTPYVLYLESFYNGKPVGMVYSTSSRNQSGNQQFLFDGDFSKLGEGGLYLRIDDTGSALVRTDQEDEDFDDFIVEIGGHAACPFGSISNKQVSSSLSSCLPK